MIHFDPLVTIWPLSEVKPGSLVRWGEEGKSVGFCVLSKNDPARSTSLIEYNPTECRFDWLYGEEQLVVQYDGDVIIAPAVGSFSPNLTPHADGTLYFLDGAPHLVPAMGNAMRFVNLNTGDLDSRRGWPVTGGYRRWRAGIRGRDGLFVKILAVTSKAASALADEGPSEPDDL